MGKFENTEMLLYRGIFSLSLTCQNEGQRDHYAISIHDRDRQRWYKEDSATTTHQFDINGRDAIFLLINQILCLLTRATFTFLCQASQQI